MKLAAAFNSTPLGICPSSSTVGTRVPKGTNGIFANPEDDGIIVFCARLQRGHRTPLSFAKKMLLDIHLLVLHSHVYQTTIFCLPIE